ncbi:hypothetical protein JOF56_010474 [Kibdelosporangium banguiense]|uniref:Uncharacterized protein n=1 Tax=Kibdelosporangium banguiense TaxID=1365924 RepID=A0ABS4U0A4_9PSEU|nr:hypothetical protein [Kibdelosporangium banguiense]MBP2330089.1 hypothetical protein [Kibdelosporangium banguiense]
MPRPSSARLPVSRCANPVSAAEFATRLVHAGVPAPFAEILASLDDGIRQGGEDRVTSAVPDITGRSARSFRDFIAGSHAVENR